MSGSIDTTPTPRKCPNCESLGTLRFDDDEEYGDSIVNEFICEHCDCRIRFNYHTVLKVVYVDGGIKEFDWVSVWPDDERTDDEKPQDRRSEKLSKQRPSSV